MQPLTNKGDRPTA